MFITEKYKLPFYSILLGTLLIIISSLVIGNLILIFGIVLIILGGAGILFIKKRETKVGFSRETQDYFPKYAIISIISAVLGMVLYFIFTPNYYTSLYFSVGLFISPSDGSYFLNLTSLPFMLVALISGVIGFRQNSLPIIEVTGATIGLVFSVMLIFPLVIGIFALVTLPFWIP